MKPVYVEDSEWNALSDKTRRTIAKNNDTIEQKCLGIKR